MTKAGIDWLIGGGEMAKVIKAKDWAATALGPMESWPQSLRTTVSLAQASNSPISLSWGVGHVQIYNDGYWPICGAKHPEAMGQDFRECWASAFEVLDEAYKSAWSGKSAYLEKVRMFLDRYGFLEETWFTFSFSPITDESGRVGGVFHPVTELTSQMLSERRTKTLRELSSRTSKAKTTAEAFALSAGVLREADLDLPFVLFYVLDEDALQARLVSAIGLPAGSSASPELVQLDAVGDACWPIADVVRSGRPRDANDVRERLGTTHVGPYPEPPKLAVAHPIAQPGSENPAGVMVIGVSPRLHMDEAYRSFLDLVASTVGAALANARAYEEQRRRAEALAEIDRVKTAFFTNVSHELRTPLTLILGPVEDAIGAGGSLEGVNLETVHRSTLRLLRLVNTLLDFSRLEAGRTEVAFEPTDLAPFTSGLAGSFRSLIESAGVKLVVDCSPLPSPVYVDRSHWEKIVLNLLSNAFKFTFEGEITVRLSSDERHVQLTVADTGTGIPAAELPRIFERFHRVEGARGRSFEGTGIGLALVDELVRLRGGTLRVESTEGRGSTFFVCIPLSTERLSSEHIVSAALRPDSAQTVSPHVVEASRWVASGATADRVRGTNSNDEKPGTKARVLVVDDNADMRAYVVRLLEAQWEVEAVEDGAVALERTLERRPDLILSDVMMPRMDGFALIRAIRENPITSTIPVVLLSARAGEEALIGGLESGADDYLVKPFSARELLGRVRTHLDLARSRRAAADAAAELAETRASLLRDLQRKHEELEAFSYSVSHDLRAPLRSIDGFSQALLEDQADKLDETGKGHLLRVRAAAVRMGQLIDDLLALSKVERAELRRREMDLSHVAQRVEQSLTRAQPAREVTFMVSGDLTADMDPRLAEILLENLLGNAWKFTSKVASAQVELGALENDGARTFFVKDNGAGFDAQYAKRLFTPFQRLHSEAEFPGTGIGLATVRRVVERHGGRVWAEGKVGAGAAIYWTIPGGRSP